MGCLSHVAGFVVPGRQGQEVQIRRLVPAPHKHPMFSGVVPALERTTQQGLVVAVVLDREPIGVLFVHVVDEIVVGRSFGYAVVELDGRGGLFHHHKVCIELARVVDGLVAVGTTKVSVGDTLGPVLFWAAVSTAILKLLDGQVESTGMLLLRGTTRTWTRRLGGGFGFVVNHAPHEVLKEAELKGLPRVVVRVAVDQKVTVAEFRQVVSNQ